MKRHRGLGVEHSGSNEFFSDANLEARETAAGYADYAPLPNEKMSDALSGSPTLAAMNAAGIALTPLPLADIEVDDGARGSDFTASDLDEPLPAPAPMMPSYYQPPPPPPVSDARIDRLESAMERIEKLLLGER